jgi:hypothetical protein
MIYRAVQLLVFVILPITAAVEVTLIISNDLCSGLDNLNALINDIPGVVGADFSDPATGEDESFDYGNRELSLRGSQSERELPNYCQLMGLGNNYADCIQDQAVTICRIYCRNRRERERKLWGGYNRNRGSSNRNRQYSYGNRNNWNSVFQKTELTSTEVADYTPAV